MPIDSNSCFLGMLADYRDTVRTKDHAAHLNLYSDDALLFDLWDHWSLRGHAALSVMTREWFDSLADETVHVGFESVESQGSSSLIAGSALLRYTAVSARGAELRFLENRLTWILREEANGWKIIHQHTSTPIDGNLKAKLKRPSSGRS